MDFDIVAALIGAIVGLVAGGAIAEATSIGRSGREALDELRSDVEALEAANVAGALAEA